MATATTYDTLVLDLKNYPWRNTASDTRYNEQIPRIIQKAIFRLGQEAPTLINRVPVIGALTANNPVLDKPSFWRATVSFAMAYGVGFTQRKPLELRTKEYIDTYWEVPADTDVPKFYGDYDEAHFIIAPTPDADYPVELVIDMQAAPLDASNQTNFWTQKAPNLLLDCCLYEMAIFLKNFDDVNTRREIYRDSLAAIMGEKARQMSDRTEKASQ